MEEYGADIRQIVKRYFGEIAPEKALLISEPEWLSRYAFQAAKRMITGLLTRNMRTWRQAAREVMKGPMIYQALQREMAGSTGMRVRELVEENAQLIKSLPRGLAEKATEFILQREQEGVRASEIAEELRPHLTHLSRSRVNLIARTETRKASTALTQARSEDLNLDAYVWRTSQDQRVRLSHRKMEDVIVFWSEAPQPERLAHEKQVLQPYHAGNVFNCRCYPEPMLRIDQVKFPHRVHRNGAIRFMTRAQFAALFSAPPTAAAA